MYTYEEFKHWPLLAEINIGDRPLCKNREVFERFLENKIELILMFPLI